MQYYGTDVGNYGLENHGIKNVDRVYWNLSTPALYEEAIRQRIGSIAHLGPLVVRTGHHTGRSPNDKFIVREPSSEDKIWWGKENRPFEQDRFDLLYNRLLAYLQGRDVYVQDCFAGADPEYRIPIRAITATAWHSLFVRNMFIRPKDMDYQGHVPDFTVIDLPHFHAVPQIDGTNSEAFILVHFGKKLVIIGGTSYGGEIKKSVFTVLNYLLPQQRVLPMHCAANIGSERDVTLFFGLSGTGKTTLSSSPERALIGDDEHGWSDKGIFNFEGGCYAKVIRLSPKDEPEIYETTRRFGTVLENVMMDTATRRMNLDDDSLTENTRAAYPITHIPNAIRSGMSYHPRNIIFLTADAFGVMPPISRLTPEQALYHFLSGYTAKVAGTERGVKEPQATFSTCFGAPFMALHPTVYAGLLGEKIAEHNVSCWLVNTGWTGGPYGVGHRMEISHTRSMIKAALNDRLKNVPMREETVFGLQVPERCPGVPEGLLWPRDTWSDKEAYDAQANKLASMFVENFRQFESKTSSEVLAAGPKEV